MTMTKISTKLITPQTPTPQNLKNYKISFVDKHLGPMNLCVVLFYQGKPETVTQLEESLAKILVQFYPLAGRYIKNDHLIDCSDKGVEFVEAQADLDVDLNSTSFLPDQYFKTDEAVVDPLMSIKATHFPSGGLTIAVSVSHRVFDVASLGTFISAWSNTANPDKTNESLITPSFDLPSLLPYKDHDFGVKLKQKNVAKIVVKRFLFNKEALTFLRSKINPNSNGKTISRVRIVCAIIAKTLIGLDRAKHGEDRDFLIFQPVDMRERTIPPLRKHACGNFSFTSLTRRVPASEVNDVGIEELVDLIGDAVRKSITDHSEIISRERDGRDIIINTLEKWVKESQNSETNVMVFSDWSRFGFYEADFGWGKPVGTSIGPQRPRCNSTVLMSNKEGDGIEAWVHLSQTDMDYFEQDEDIKSFTT